MTSGLKLNLLLMAVAVLLAAVVYFEPGKEKPAVPAKLTTLTTAQVTHIAIIRTDQPDIKFSKQGMQWRMETPYATAADEERIGFLLDFLEAKSGASFPVEKADLPKYALDKPRAVLTLNDQVFEFGDSNPMTMQRYIRHGDTIYMLFDTAYQYLITEPGNYVSPRLIDEGAKIDNIKVLGLSVEQHDGKLFSTPAATSSDQLARYVEEWRQARALNVRALDQSQKDAMAKATDKLDVTWTPDGKRVWVILSRDPDWVLARTDLPLAYTLPAETAKKLLSLDTGVPAAKDLAPSSAPVMH
jgi:hypothetical protein